MSHLDALQLRLSNERLRLVNAKTKKERELRSVWIKQIQQEVRGEVALLVNTAIGAKSDEMSDDELITALSA